MESLYTGVSVGFGFLLFYIGLSFIWLLFKNYKKRILPQNKYINIADLKNFQVEEGRKERRVDIIWPVSVVTANGIGKAETKQLSRSGAFIKCRNPLPIGEKFNMTIEIPSKGYISLKSEVIWSNAGIPEHKVVNRGMSVKFKQNMENDLASLISALEEYVVMASNAPAQRIALI